MKMTRDKRPKSFEANVQPLAAKLLELANENMNKSWKSFWKRRSKDVAEQLSKTKDPPLARQKSTEENKKTARRQKSLEGQGESRNSLKRKSLGGANELLFKAWKSFWTRRLKKPKKKCDKAKTDTRKCAEEKYKIRLGN